MRWLEMFKFEMFSFYYHYWDNCWNFDIFLIEADFEYGDSRSLFGIGKKDQLWFLDLFWIRILPRIE